MMNTWTHLLATTALAFMAVIIHVMIRNDASVRPLDTARYYTMVRERGDVGAAKQLVSNDDNWLSAACRPNVSKALPTTDPCVEERRALRNKILAAMNCFTYSSQVCSYLRNITAGIIQNRTVTGTTYAMGRSLAGTVPNQGTLTYRQLLYNAIEQAPFLFHNSYRAAQADDSYVLRTVLYNFVVFAILGNILVHFLDQYHMSWGKRLVMRIIVFSLTTFLVSFLFLLSGMGSFFTAGVGVWVPGLLVLLYYEAFLDATITRPWCVLVLDGACLCLACLPLSCLLAFVLRACLSCLLAFVLRACLSRLLVCLACLPLSCLLAFVSLACLFLLLLLPQA